MYSRSEAIPLFVATPELLAHYGIDPASINAGTDLLTPRASIDGYDLIPRPEHGAGSRSCST